MSIKSLALLVVLLVAGVFASVRSYLQVERSPLVRQVETAPEAPGAPSEAQCDLSSACSDPTAVAPARDGHRRIRRSSLAFRRGERADQAPRDS